MSRAANRLAETWGADAAGPEAEDDEEENPMDTAMFLYTEALKVIEDPGSGDATSDLRSLLRCCVDAAREAVAAGGSGMGGAQALLADASILLGRAVEWKDPAGAQRLFEGALEAHPSSAEAHLQLGRSLFHRAASTADLERAEALLRQAVALAGDDSDNNADSAGVGSSEGRDAVKEDGDDDYAEDNDGDGDCFSEGGEGSEGDDTLHEARRLLARLLCQHPDRGEQARQLLLRMGFTHRLAHGLASFDFLRCSSFGASAGRFADGGGGAAVKAGCATVAAGGGGVPVSAFDRALPPALADKLRRALGTNAPFWSEHAYGSPATGFFSYAIKLPPFDQTGGGGIGIGSSDSSGGGGDGTSVLERVALHHRSTASAAVPGAKAARFAEFWAHRRPHTSGHGLHFDYVRRPGGCVSHPIVSTVTYLTSPCGGPTLVTDQTMPRDDDGDDDDGEGKAVPGGTTKGWVVVPSPNRLLVFKGSLLHCVLPGVGPRPHVPTAASAGAAGGGGAAATAAAEKGPGAGVRVGKRKARSAEPAAAAAHQPSSSPPSREDGGGDGGGEEEDEPRRLTFMMALWREDPGAPRFPCHAASSDASAGSSAGTSTGATDRPRWPSTFLGLLEAEEAAWTGAERNFDAVRCVPRVWETLAEEPAGPAASATSERQIEGLDMLSASCFADASALDSGLFVAGATGACSLNCGGTCPACAAASKKKQRQM